MNYSYTSSFGKNETLAQNTAVMSPVVGFIYLALIILIIVSLWKIFTKANKPGWYCIIPIFNIYILLKIVGKPGWWVILYFIPIVNIIISLLVAIDLAKSFGRSETFGVVALWLFGIVGYPMLAFGSSKYVGPGHIAGTTTTPTQPVAPTPAATQS